MTALRLGFVALIFVFLAVAGFNSNLLAYLVAVAAFLVAVTVFQNRYAEGVRDAAQDTERLHRPNEVGFIVVCGYVQWGLGAVAALGIAWAMRASEFPSLWFLAGFVLAIGVGALGRAVENEMGAWAEARLRLRSLTHASIEVVLVADKSLPTQPIEATAEYSRTTSGSNDTLRSQVLWKSPSSSGEQREPSRVVRCRPAILRRGIAVRRSVTRAAPPRVEVHRG